jgi:hypothetical protein
MSELITTRRELLLAPLIAALPMALLSNAAGAAGPDPAMTIVKLPDQLSWTKPPDFPHRHLRPRPDHLPQHRAQHAGLAQAVSG